MRTPSPPLTAGDDQSRGGVDPFPIYDQLLREAQGCGALLEGVPVPVPADLRQPTVSERRAEARDRHRGTLDQLSGVLDRIECDTPTVVVPAAPQPEPSAAHGCPGAAVHGAAHAGPWRAHLPPPRHHAPERGREADSFAWLPQPAQAAQAAGRGGR